MAELVWDDPAERVYETGIDRGMVYSPITFRTEVWNGLVSVKEEPSHKVEHSFNGGPSTHVLATVEDYKATVQAFTRPYNFANFEGYYKVRPGVHLADQRPIPFHFAYRTRVGTPEDSDAGYKIHIIYNVTASARSRQTKTLEQKAEAFPFEWALTATPEKISGHRRSAQVVVDSRQFSPIGLSLLESYFWGDESRDPGIVPMDWVLGMSEIP